MLSPVDKVFEFNDKAIFYNMVINREYIDDDPLIIRIIRKNNFAVVIVKEQDNDSFKIPNQMVKKFKFKKASDTLTTEIKLDPSNSKNEPSNSMLNSFEIQEPEIEKDDVGKIIIQKMNTIKPNSNDEITIDYILFWLANEGLKRIEYLINDRLL